LGETVKQPGPDFAVLANAHVLVSGANGFIAGYLLPRLVEYGAKVVAAAPDWGWRPWVISLVEEGKITFVKADALTPEGSEQLTPYLADVEYVIHLARVWAQGSSPLELAVDEINRNLLGTLRFLSVASELGAGIVYPSSVEVYGIPERLPLCEDHPLRPVSPYAIAKAAAEGFLRAHSAKKNAAITIMRYASVYGPGELEPRAIPNFIRAALRGDPPLVDGDGLDVRDYVYVVDVVEATLRALVATRKRFHIYNVGTGIGYKTIDLAREIILLTGSNLKPAFRSSDRIPLEIVCDISKARDELGYLPAYTLEEGLSAEIRWFRDNPTLWNEKGNA
jgi:UDP-glucose 4-epimerase